MKITIALLMVVVFVPAVLARSWPKWVPAHVSEIRFRDGVPGTRVRVVVDRAEIEKILAAFRRAKKATKEAAVQKWQVSVDFIGERPEAGRWLLNLDTGDCTFLDPLIQPIYRLAEEDREMLMGYFRKTETQTNAPQHNAMARPVSVFESRSSRGCPVALAEKE